MSSSRRLRSLVVALCAVAALMPAVPASAAVAPPRTPTGLPVAIEPLASYVEQSSCDPGVKPGTAKLATLLAATYRGTTWASAYACGTDGVRSEHYEGRAIDWMVSVRNATQKADATAVLSWMLATDTHHNRFAIARRLGVQYIIYNNRIWGSWNGAWAPYNNCATHPEASMDNACHRTHMHISLSWNGALGLTSFWAKRTYSFDYGPCRPRDLNWAITRSAFNGRPCPSFATVTAPRGASATKVALVRFSGATLSVGSTGPAVVAVQRALHVTASGSYSAATRAAVVAFQRAHHLPTHGVMSSTTWRTLLAATR